jgi:hypothetical protein
MNTNPQEPDAPTSAQPAPPRLRTARFEDYPQIQRLESAHLPETIQAEDWRGLFLDNPLWPRLGNTWPIGWVLEDTAGQIVGSITNIPSLYRFRGGEQICANGRGWIVAPEYRGYALWLMNEYFSQGGADLFINTTVNVNAVPVVSALSARVPLGDWQTTAFRVTRYHGFARKVLEFKRVPLAGALATPAAAALWLKDTIFGTALSSGPASVDIATTDSFCSDFEAFWEELVRQNPEKLLAARDRQALCWHFAISMRQKRLRVFAATRGNLLSAYCVVKQHHRSRQGVSSMRLIDYQTVDRDVDLLQAALRCCAAEDIHLLEHLGYGLPKMRSFDTFAPYRARRPCWPFYYRAADPTLDAELRKPDAWDPSEFDGDTSYM